jgi:hypothetical protein
LGPYILLYSGTGNVSVSGDAYITNYQPQRVQVTVFNKTSSIFIRILRTNVSDPVYNVRLIPAQYENTYDTTDVFHPNFLNLLQPFDTLFVCGW